MSSEGEIRSFGYHDSVAATVTVSPERSRIAVPSVAATTMPLPTPASGEAVKEAAVKEAVLAVRDGLQRGIVRREADTSAAVSRVLHALGWDAFDPDMISPVPSKEVSD